MRASTDVLKGLGRRPTALFLLYNNFPAAYEAERPAIWQSSHI